MGFFRPLAWAAKPNDGLRLPKCGACGLYKECISPKMGVTGKGKRKILFVGEAPGEREDRIGEQFVGDAGKVLKKILRSINVDIGDCWKTNAVICRPPKNKITDLYIDSCRPNLLRVIRELKPNVIILLGMSAVKSLIGAEWTRNMGQMGTWVGWRIPSGKWGAWICPTYHPSYVARLGEDPTIVRIVTEHLRTAVALEKSPVPTESLDLHSRIDVVLDKSEARMRLLELVRSKGILAFDYETTGLKPDDKKHRIVSCSFCTDRERAWACMMVPILYPLLTRVLRNKKLKKVASNLKFEERWTRAKLGVGVRNWHWDTMLAAHILDNRSGITSVKFQSFVLLGAPLYDSAVSPYLEAKTANGFNRIDQIPERDLLLYNGMDSLLEYRVMEKQKEAFASK
jgi:uracil-DNA glycosylase family 4